MINQPGDHFAHGDDPVIEPNPIDDLVAEIARDLVDDLTREAFADAIAHRWRNGLSLADVISDTYTYARRRANEYRARAFRNYAGLAHADGIAYARAHGIGAAYRAAIAREFVADVSRFTPEASWITLGRIGL